MNRRTLVRLQLFLLALLVLGLMGRRMWTSVGRADAVAMEGMKPFELHHVAFSVPAYTRVEIQAAGSLEAAEANAPMAATAWIIPHDAYQPVWQLDSREGHSRRGTLVRATDQIALEPGRYDAYFASFGHEIGATGGFGLFRRFFGASRPWEKDSGRWRLSVRPLEEQPDIVRIDAPADSDSDATPGLVWRAAPMASRRSERKVFEVTQPVEVHVRAIGELSDDGTDAGWIDNLSERRRVWELKLENSVPAGGHHSNRLFDGRIRLLPGVYAANFETDASHAPDHWRANPPYNPNGWGMSLWTDPALAGSISSFNPWESRSPLLALSRMGTNQHDRIEFAVSEPVDVVIDALGEISSSKQYDYGWIENESGEHVWEMRYANTSYAGGDWYNREAIEIIRLQPGTYTAHFQTDDSHAYGDWRKDKPRQPERWGMTIFPINPETSSEAVSLIERATNVPQHPPLPPGISERLHLPDVPIPEIPRLEELRRHLAVQIVGVGNGENRRENFQIDQQRKVVVVAQGEMTSSERYDYAWIERADNGETVWSMNWDNTRPAGGDDRNRLFAGTVELPAGEYVVRYRSDPSHAFGDFGKIAPSDPESWGVTVVVPPH